MSADAAVRGAFFASLSDASNRGTESWVLDAPANLHHSMRTLRSACYLHPGRELLEEIQETWGIFFPER